MRAIVASRGGGALLVLALFLGTLPGCNAVLGMDAPTLEAAGGAADSPASELVKSMCRAQQIVEKPHDPILQMRGITVGADRNLWVAESNDETREGRIVKVTLAGEFTTYPLPTPQSYVQGTVLGPDGAVWFTEPVAMQIGRITVDGVITEYPLPAGGSWPRWITVGPDNNIWFARSSDSDHPAADNPDNGDSLGYIDPVTTEIREFPVTPEGHLITTLIAGPDGNMWFPENLQIGKMAPTTGEITWYTVEVPLYLDDNNFIGMTVGPDKNIWFTGGFGDNAIGAMTPDGKFLKRVSIPSVWPDSVPTLSTLPGAMITTADGNIWFLEYAASQLAKFDFESQIITEHKVGFGKSLAHLVEAPDGNIWFTEKGVIGCYGRR